MPVQNTPGTQGWGAICHTAPALSSQPINGAHEGNMALGPSPSPPSPCSCMRGMLVQRVSLTAPCCSLLHPCGAMGQAGSPLSGAVQTPVLGLLTGSDFHPRMCSRVSMKPRGVVSSRVLLSPESLSFREPRDHACIFPRSATPAFPP